MNVFKRLVIGIKQKRPKLSLVLCFLILLYWLPFLFIYWWAQSLTISTVENLPRSDVAVVFGTLVNDRGDISPLLKERLDAGKAIFAGGRGHQIVVSNTSDAAHYMSDYLEKNGIPPTRIEIDTMAETTLDTCRYEKKKHNESRYLIFVSQGFHLPRILFQCKRLGIDGVAFPAESLEVTDRPQYSWWTKFSVRTKRYVRESGLIWLSLLNIYK